MSSPVTKLEAVNIMLSVTGEAPVTQLNSGLVEADVAETILESVNREVQGQGFDFNRELNVTFNPDSNNNIVLPANILRADSTQRTAISTSFSVVSRCTIARTTHSLLHRQSTWTLSQC